MTVTKIGTPGAPQVYSTLDAAVAAAAVAVAVVAWVKVGDVVYRITGFGSRITRAN